MAPINTVDVDELTIAQVHESFKLGHLTAAALCTAYLDRIQRFDKSGPRINSTMALSATSLEEAAALDAHLRETGELKGSLHGIPILVKDQADTKGIVTTYGSAIAKHNVPDQDATVVTNLKQAGAVILGKTTMAEWAATWFSASGATDYEFTRNPYNLEHDVGASSGGSAAAVAANFCMLAVGEDTGGSIRVPSSFCNIAGIRVTPGLISRAGFCPLVKVQDTPGPMARTVRDCALMLDCMVGFDPLDTFTGIAAIAASLGLPRGGSYAASLNDGLAELKSARLGILRQRFGSDSDPHCHATNKVINTVLEAMEQAGTKLVEVDMNDLHHRLVYTQTYTIRSRSDINSFLSTKPHLPQDLADIVPHEPTKPWLDLVSKMAHGPLQPASDSTYADRLLKRDDLKREVDYLFALHELNALVMPTVQFPPPHCSDAHNGRFDGSDFPTNTFLASQARLPAVSVPAGFTEKGLPVGLELVGMEFHEQNLLRLARGVEMLIEARKVPPGL